MLRHIYANAELVIVEIFLQMSIEEDYSTEGLILIVWYEHLLLIGTATYIPHSLLTSELILGELRIRNAIISVNCSSYGYE